MRRLFLLPLLAVVIFGAALPCANAQATSWKDVKIPALHDFKPAQPKRVELPNGMVILLQEDHELPVIDGFARIRGGSREEPAQKVGLVDTLADSWRTGGTKSKTGDELDDFLEARAAKVETGATVDSTDVSFSCLKADFDDVFAIFADVLRNPEFRQDKIDLSKDGNRADISRRNDDASGIAQRESTKLGYGAQNPYARHPEYATLDAITRQDLLDWHNAHVHPNNIMLGIVGDFDSAALEAKLRKAFQGWAKGPATVTPKIDFQPAKPGYFLIDKKDVNQSNIYMVELGTKRNNPDYYAINVFNEAFGGGFSSRLFSNIRSKRGLAYGVGGGIGTSFDHDGLVRIVMGTKSSTTIESIQALYEEIDGLARNPLSDDEIRRAKDSILNSFVFNFDSPAKVLHEQMAYAFYGYPADYLERFRAGIEKVTPADVARAAAKYLHQDQLAVLVVGNSAEFDKPLSSLGTVTTVDITIPEPAGDKTGDKPGDEPAAKPAASNPEGKALAAKVVAAMGGAARLKAIQSLQSTFTLTQKTPQGDMKMPAVATIVFPDHMHVDLQTPDGAFAIVATPEAGFMSAAERGVQDMPESRNRESLEQIKRDPIYLAQHVDDPAFSFAAAGTEKIGAVETHIVDVSGPGVAIRWYVDPATGHILREAYKTNGPHGPSEGVTNLSNWETTDGISLPKLHTNQMNGQDSSSAEFTAIQFNPVVDPKLFEKPKSETKSPQ
jgi:zinc protease